MTEISTIVLLDPLRPHVFPLAALSLLSGPIRIDDTVPASVRDALPKSTSDAAVVVTLDAGYAEVPAQAKTGVQIIRAVPVQGDRLVEAASIMDRLWSRGGWEATQTHESLSVYLVEETYEVLDAIRSGDEIDLREELGDLLLQVLFHSRIAQAHHVFDLDDVAAALIEKLIHRSPHLRSLGVVDIAEQERAWEELKAAEKARASAMDGIATSQPPILLAAKVRARAEKAGVSDVIDEQELARLVAQCTQADAELAGALRALIDEIRARESESR
ncbi:MazG family protein [Rhodococcus sp. KBS0724]|uniref:MazG family protein n=1 Tax=Rhodococcus sp. KBS0724 TaxID=1179674 RepID=UPI0037CC4E9E